MKKERKRERKRKGESKRKGKGQEIKRRLNLINHKAKILGDGTQNTRGDVRVIGEGLSVFKAEIQAWRALRARQA